MASDLSTTNVFLGIMAAVSVLQVLVVVGLGVAGFAIYRRVLQVIDGLEERQVAPAAARVNAILDDVKDVAATMKKETGHVERLIEWIVAGIGRRQRRPPSEPPTHVM